MSNFLFFAYKQIHLSAKMRLSKFVKRHDKVLFKDRCPIYKSMIFLLFKRSKIWSKYYISIQSKDFISSEAHNCQTMLLITTQLTESRQSEFSRDVHKENSAIFIRESSTMSISPSKPKDLGNH